MNFNSKLLAAALVFLLVALIFGAAFAQKTKPAGPAPRAVMPELQVNLGEVLEGQTIEHVFRIRNTGAGELQILSARPG